jgi:hypothetical protein
MDVLSAYQWPMLDKPQPGSGNPCAIQNAYQPLPSK